jgi:hypothetical protein
MLPNSYGDVIALPPDDAIHRAVFFEIPPFLSNYQDAAAGADPDNDTTMTLPELISGRGADLVLETTFSDQATAGGVITDTILHKRQQTYSLDGSKNQKDQAELMDQQEDLTPLHRQHVVEHPFLLLCEATIHHLRLFWKTPKRTMINSLLGQ